MSDSDRNSYYELAWNDSVCAYGMRYSEDYNTVSYMCHQAVEKSLKSVLECLPDGDGSLMRSHNLTKLYNAVCKGCHIQSLSYDYLYKLGNLSDTYFNCRYPGEEFVIITRDECTGFIAVARRVTEQVNDIRKKYGLPTKTFFYTKEEKLSEEPLFKPEDEYSELRKYVNEEDIEDFLRVVPKSSMESMDLASLATLYYNMKK